MSSPRVRTSFPNASQFPLQTNLSVLIFESGSAGYPSWTMLWSRLNAIYTDLTTAGIIRSLSARSSVCRSATATRWFTFMVITATCSSHKMMIYTRVAVSAILMLTILAPFIQISPQSTSVASKKLRWYKGNLHTHTTNSDGDSSPEDVVRWYKANGYDFVAITDHEHITAVDGLNSEFGKDGAFLVIRGQEVTDR